MEADGCLQIMLLKDYLKNEIKIKHKFTFNVQKTRMLATAHKY